MSETGNIALTWARDIFVWVCIWAALSALNYFIGLDADRTLLFWHDIGLMMLTMAYTRVRYG